MRLLKGRLNFVALGAVMFPIVLIFGMVTPTSSSSASTSASAVPGINGDTITVGGIYDSSTWAGAQAGFMARVDRANKDHDLGKYKIKVVAFDDDQENPTTDQSDVQNLIERSHVFALAPVITEGFQQASATFASNSHTPYFGAGFTPGFCKPYTWGYSWSGCDTGGGYFGEESIISIAKALHKPIKSLRWALVGLDVPNGPSANESYAKTIQKDGGKVVYNKAPVPENVGNLAPIINAVEATKPDVVMAQLATQAIGFESALESTGFSGVAINEALYSPGLLKTKALATALNNTYVITSNPVLEEHTAYDKQMERDYAADGLPQSAINFGGEYGYLTADMMVAMLKKVEPNFGSLHSIIGKGFSFTPVAGGSPLKYPFEWNAPTNCDGVVKIVNATYVPVVPFACSTKYIKS